MEETYEGIGPISLENRVYSGRFNFLVEHVRSVWETKDLHESKTKKNSYFDVGLAAIVCVATLPSCCAYAFFGGIKYSESDEGYVMR